MKISDPLFLVPEQTQASSAILSVSELSLSLKRVVEGTFSSIHVRGEISGLKRHTSGHYYLSLKDQNSVIDAVCWRGTKLSIALEEGLEIIAHGRLTIYAGRSKYQLVIDDAKAAGQGALLKLLEDRKIRLEAEGLFKDKKPLPPFPKRIGIVTSPTGAVIQDILHRLQDRYPCSVLLWPVLVQGPGAADQVTTAINGMNALPLDQRPDLLIVARGGGSIEDLWTFNEENVVRATANSAIPVISAIGHETDTTLIDYASDRRAPTPTAAAELATPVLSQVLDAIRSLADRVSALVSRMLHSHAIHLVGLGRGLPAPEHVLETALLRLDDWTERLSGAGIGVLQNKENRLTHIIIRFRSPQQQLDNAHIFLDRMTEKLADHQGRFFEKKADLLKWQSLRLAQNSYERVLERGFCWASFDGGVITSAADVKAAASQTIALHFADGKALVRPILDERA
ncbi:MAG: exodeoxyribonuclease VII large subunit [Alphaproteobacteria bacterium]|nr:exodeoxyribonuclease VII large subunit [Alphaproteobacteria bacterium]